MIKKIKSFFTLPFYLNPCPPRIQPQILLRIEDPLRIVTGFHILAKGSILAFAYLLLGIILMKTALRKAKK